jgi:hypothetical protein
MLDETKIIKELLKSTVHDLKNLLAPIVLYSELIQESHTGGSNSDNIGVVLSRAEEIDRHLNAIRLLYNEESWVENSSVALLIERLALLCRTRFRSKKMPLNWRYSKDILPIEDDMKGKGMALLGQILDVSGKSEEAQTKEIWILVFVKKGKIIWEIYEGSPEGDFENEKEIACLLPERLIELKKLLNKPLSVFC